MEVHLAKEGFIQKIYLLVSLLKARCLLCNSRAGGGRKGGAGGASKSKDSDSDVQFEASASGSSEEESSDSDDDKPKKKVRETGLYLANNNVRKLRTQELYFCHLSFD